VPAPFTPAERRLARGLAGLCLLAVLWHTFEGLRPPPPPPVLIRGALTPDSTLIAAARSEEPTPWPLNEGDRPHVGSLGPDDRIDITHAGADSLQMLPGIGPVLAERIVAWRRDREGPILPDDLLEVKGIGPVLLARIRPLLAHPDTAGHQRPEDRFQGFQGLQRRGEWR
jgi:hypothetical protein